MTRSTATRWIFLSSSTLVGRGPEEHPRHHPFLLEVALHDEEGLDRQQGR